MYYTGVDPRTMEPVYVPKNPHEKAMQRALIQYRNPKNYDLVHEALIKAGRTDLIGFDKLCLIRPRKIGYKNPNAAGKNIKASNSAKNQSRENQNKNTGSHNRNKSNQNRNTESQNRKTANQNHNTRNNNIRTNNSAQNMKTTAKKKKSIRNVHKKKG